jgi:protein-L-isoaspartate(D-aspartate) O-methyltransferase
VLFALGLALAPRTTQAQPDYAAERRRMVAEQLEARGIQQQEVLDAMAEVPRHLFVPESMRSEAYIDGPVPFRRGQAISQPYIVARMTELLDLERGDKVLEVGTGSGYHTAVLSRIADEVYSVEIDAGQAASARETLERLGYDNVEIRVGDGFEGWPQQGRFDAIILSAAPSVVPSPLLAQLADGGRMVLPVGGFVQELRLVTRRQNRLEVKVISPVRFAPMERDVERAIRNRQQ